MKFLSEHKGKIIALIVFLVVIFVYKLLFSTNEEISLDAQNSQNVGRDIIALNASIAKIDLDSPLFHSRPFKNLIDFSIVVPPQPVGRTNPFDQIGR